MSDKYQKTIYNLVHLSKAKMSFDGVYINQKQLEQDINVLWELHNKYQELTHQPTLSECIKEWEDRGWKTSYICDGINLSKLNDDIEEYFYFDKDLKRIDCNCFISFDLIPLIHKTIKALEVSE